MGRWWNRTDGEPAAGPAPSVPAPPAPAAWRELPPIQRAVTPTPAVAPLHSFAAGLVTAHHPGFLAPLGHSVDPAGPAGHVHGLVEPVAPTTYAATDPLPVVESAPPPNRLQRMLSAPVVQRALASPMVQRVLPAPATVPEVARAATAAHDPGSSVDSAPVQLLPAFDAPPPAVDLATVAPESTGPQALVRPTMADPHAAPRVSNVPASPAAVQRAAEPISSAWPGTDPAGSPASLRTLPAAPVQAGGSPLVTAAQPEGAVVQRLSPAPMSPPAPNSSASFRAEPAAGPRLPLVDPDPAPPALAVDSSAAASESPVVAAERGSEPSADRPLLPDAPALLESSHADPAILPGPVGSAAPVPDVTAGPVGLPLPAPVQRAIGEPALVGLAHLLGGADAPAPAAGRPAPRARIGLPLSPGDQGHSSSSPAVQRNPSGATELPLPAPVPTASHRGGGASESSVPTTAPSTTAAPGVTPTLGLAPPAGLGGTVGQAVEAPVATVGPAPLPTVSRTVDTPASVGVAPLPTVSRSVASAVADAAPVPTVSRSVASAVTGPVPFPTVGLALDAPRGTAGALPLPMVGRPADPPTGPAPLVAGPPTVSRVVDAPLPSAQAPLPGAQAPLLAAAPAVSRAVSPAVDAPLPTLGHAAQAGSPADGAARPVPVPTLGLAGDAWAPTPGPQSALPPAISRLVDTPLPTPLQATTPRSDTGPAGSTLPVVSRLADPAGTADIRSPLDVLHPAPAGIGERPGASDPHPTRPLLAQRVPDPAASTTPPAGRGQDSAPHTVAPADPILDATVARTASVLQRTRDAADGGAPPTMDAATPLTVLRAVDVGAAVRPELAPVRPPRAPAGTAPAGPSLALPSPPVSLSTVAAAVSAGVAQRVSADTVEFAPPPGHPAASEPDLAAPPPVQRAVADPVVQTAATPAPAAGGEGSALPTDLDELARRLFEPLSARLKTELWLDRERAGLISELRR